MDPDEIRQRRTDVGMSQVALAQKLGVTQATISKWESGKSAPSPQQDKNLHVVLSVEPTRKSYEVLTDTYGAWLENTRSELGLTRKELAAKSGVSSIQIFNIETHRTENPRSATRSKIERALGRSAPRLVVEATEREAHIGGLGPLIDFDPHDTNDYPSEPGVYVFYDISDRPIYIGQSGNIRTRIIEGHLKMFWYRTPIVYKASYVKVDDRKLRKQLESTLIRFLKSNAVLNVRQVERD